MPSLKRSKRHQLSENAKKPRCATCPYLQEGQQFKLKNDRNYNIHSSITFECSNSIYVIICAGSGEHYLGQTGDTLRHGMTVHRQILDVTCRHNDHSK